MPLIAYTYLSYLMHPMASCVAQEEMRKLPYVDCVVEKGYRPAELAAEIRRQSRKKAARRVSARRVEELIASAQNASSSSASEYGAQYGAQYGAAAGSVSGLVRRTKGGKTSMQRLASLASQDSST